MSLINLRNNYVYSRIKLSNEGFTNPNHYVLNVGLVQSNFVVESDQDWPGTLHLILEQRSIASIESRYWKYVEAIVSTLAVRRHHKTSSHCWTSFQSISILTHIWSICYFSSSVCYCLCFILYTMKLRLKNTSLNHRFQKIVAIAYKCSFVETLLWTKFGKWRRSFTMR